ncbi:hypothetical protein [Krasilnikovia sp. MM14-A1004]|uniref:hypothetical protein n=1 Tax=Krasilnikovia sp. MM14-A1004 TaxID=3373541 RepID=UPI00399C58DE
MSDKDRGKDKPGVSARRSTAVRIGGIAAGAVLGAALGANLVVPEHPSISEQFEAAFTPGTSVEAIGLGGIIVPGDIN